MLTDKAALNKDKRSAECSGLQHRHFAVIAGVIAKIHPRMRSEIAWHFAGELRATNPRFNQERFLVACNVKEEK